MIDRVDDRLSFKLTKEHNIEYINHTYYKKTLCSKNLLNGNLTKKEWSNEKIRYELFKYYFINNRNATNESCKIFFKELLKDKFGYTNEIDNEIKKCKLSIDYTNGNFKNMINKLENMVDENNNKCTYIVELNTDIYQYFGDATFIYVFLQLLEIIDYMYYQVLI